MPTDRGVNKEDVVHAYNGALFSHKKEQNKKPILVTWIDLESVTVSDGSQRQIPYDIAYMWNLKKCYKRYK